MNTITKNHIQNGQLFSKSYSSLFDNLFKEAFFENRKDNYVPATQIAEDEKAYYLSLTIPGIDKEAINIEINDAVITISGEKKRKENEDTKTYHLVESYFESFKRSFKLPENSNKEAIEAEYTHGILHLTVPKTDANKAKSIITIK